VVTDPNGMGMFGTLAQLNTAVPQFVDDALGSGTKNGYNYAVDLSAQVPGFPAFAARATPINGNFGSRAFYVDQRGVITFTNDGSVPNANSSPVQ
jgi:type IV pilus assembly protein PilA